MIGRDEVEKSSFSENKKPFRKSRQPFSSHMTSHIPFEAESRDEQDGIQRIVIG